MKPLTRREVVLGALVPAVVVVLLIVLAHRAVEPAPWIAFLAAVPMFAAMFAPVLITAVVSLVCVLGGAVTAAGTYGQHFSDALPILFGVIVGAGAAVLASQAKTAPVRAVAAPAGVPRAHVPLEDQADVDAVTGLPTRAAVLRGFAVSPPPGPRVVALIDADGLAAFNDAHGRDVGDVFLFAVGGRTRYALGDDDLVARWEGDELLLVIDAAPGRIAETLRLIADKVNVNPIRTDSGLVTATISVGAVPWAPGEPFVSAVARARQALYAAKAQGPGNLVFAAGDGPEPD